MSAALKLTMRQAKVLAACALCHRPLDWRGVKGALESGEVHPPDMYCRGCGIRSRRGVPAGEALTAALTMLRRIEAVGLTEHYERVAAETGYPPRRPAA